MTIKDIAEEAGVSLMTASRALRDAGDVSPKTREKVLKIAAELGYRPNLSARAVRRGGTGCIALLESTQTSYNTSDLAIIHAIQDVLREHNMHLTFARMTPAELTDGTLFAQRLTEYMADGLLVAMGIAIPEGFTEILERYRVPAVWFNTRRSTDCVMLDDLQAGRDLTQHLIELGHQRILYAASLHAGPYHYSRDDRPAGYCAAMNAAGLEPFVQILEAGSSLDLLDFARQCLTAEPSPTAVVCYSGRTASAFIRTAGEILGRPLPGGLSVAVVERSPGYCGMRLTTAVNPFGKMARRATEMLLAKLKDPRRVFPAEAVPYEIEIGESTCAPSGATGDT